MFDLDLSKMVLFGVIALVVIGPKDLPAALRVAGRVAAQLRRVRGDIRRAADSLMADASLDREIAAVEDAARLTLARNPATAMRGSLPGAEPILVGAEMSEYATPEMQAYLAPLAAEPASTAECLESAEHAG
jgi:sec-independent protein translocase protein TatB